MIKFRVGLPGPFVWSPQRHRHEPGPPVMWLTILAGCMIAAWRITLLVLVICAVCWLAWWLIHRET